MALLLMQLVKEPPAVLGFPTAAHWVLWLFLEAVEQCLNNKIGSSNASYECQGDKV